MICQNCQDYQDFGIYIPMYRDGNNGSEGLIGNMGFSRSGRGYRGYNGAYQGQGNCGGGWPTSFKPSFIPYNSYSSCARCGYCLDDVLFG